MDEQLTITASVLTDKGKEAKALATVSIYFDYNEECQPDGNGID